MANEGRTLNRAVILRFSAPFAAAARAFRGSELTARSLSRPRAVSSAVILAMAVAAVLAIRLAANYGGSARERSFKGAAHALVPGALPPQGRIAAAAPPAPVPRNAAISRELGLEDALTRVHRVLAAFPDEKAENIIEGLRQGRIHVDPSSCILAWNHGQPELLVRDTDRRNAGATLTDCASAIESARNKR